MNVKDLVKLNNWKLINENDGLNREVKGAFVGDLLSFVMGNGEPDNAWITIQSHLNVIAVAMLREFSCIIFVDGANVTQDMIDKANEENLILIQSDSSAYDSAIKLYNSKI